MPPFVGMQAPEPDAAVVVPSHEGKQPPPGPIPVTEPLAASTFGLANFSVSDNGVGIPADQLPQLFERFWRGHSNSSGAGLGLFIVKRVVEAHGGRIWIDSDLGHTTFHVALPTGREERRFAS